MAMFILMLLRIYVVVSTFSMKIVLSIFEPNVFVVKPGYYFVLFRVLSFLDLDEVSHMDVAMLDCILRLRPVDLEYTIVRNMLNIPKLITRSLPYGHFITRILKYFDVPIKEPSCRPSKGIGDDAIFGLGFEWKKWHLGQIH